MVIPCHYFQSCGCGQEDLAAPQLCDCIQRNHDRLVTDPEEDHRLHIDASRGNNYGETFAVVGKNPETRATPVKYIALNPADGGKLARHRGPSAEAGNQICDSRPHQRENNNESNDD